MTLNVSRFVVLDLINEWLSTGGPFLIGGKVVDGRELKATGLVLCDGDAHIEVVSTPTKGNECGGDK